MYQELLRLTRSRKKQIIGFLTITSLGLAELCMPT